MEEEAKNAIHGRQHRMKGGAGSIFGIAFQPGAGGATRVQRKRIRPAKVNDEPDWRKHDLTRRPKKITGRQGQQMLTQTGPDRGKGILKRRWGAGSNGSLGEGKKGPGTEETLAHPEQIGLAKGGRPVVQEGGRD